MRKHIAVVVASSWLFVACTTGGDAAGESGNADTGRSGDPTTAASPTVAAATPEPSPTAADADEGDGALAAEGGATNPDVVIEIAVNNTDFVARLDDVDVGSVCAIADGATTIRAEQDGVRFAVVEEARLATIYTDTATGAGYFLDLDLATVSTQRSVNTDIFVLAGVAVPDSNLDDDVVPEEPLIGYFVQVACGPEAQVGIPERG